MAQPNMESDKCQLSYLGGANIAKGQEWLGDANAPATCLYEWTATWHDTGPSPRAGGDSGLSERWTHYQWFQSTPRRGGRLCHGQSSEPGPSFNPRPGAGGDQSLQTRS